MTSATPPADLLEGVVRVLEPAFRPLATEWPSLAFAVAYVAFWIAVAGVLYRRRIRIQV